MRINNISVIYSNHVYADHNIISQIMQNIKSSDVYGKPGGGFVTLEMLDK